MTRRRIIVLAALVSVLLVGNGCAVAADKAQFVSGCLKAKGATTAECECQYEEIRRTLPPEEAAFLIASTVGDTAKIQEAASKLSSKQIIEVFLSFGDIVDKCLSL